MTRRLNMINAFSITTDRRNYIVTLERLKNTINGAPRFKAVIIFTEPEAPSFYNAVYTFTGHYRSDYQEAAEIVRQYEEANKEA